MILEILLICDTNALRQLTLTVITIRVFNSDNIRRSCGDLNLVITSIIEEGGGRKGTGLFAITTAITQTSILIHPSSQHNCDK